MNFTILIFCIFFLCLAVLYVRKWKVAYVIILGIVGILSSCTVGRYTHPQFSIFSNADYHVLENLGLEFEDSLYIANEFFPEMAFLEQKYGQLVLAADPDSIQYSYLRTHNFHEPIFVQHPRVTTGYTLENASYPYDISTGFEVGRYIEDFPSPYPWLTVEIVEQEGTPPTSWVDTYLGNNREFPGLRDSCTYRITYWRETIHKKVNGKDTLTTISVDPTTYISRFSRRLNIGLALGSILQESNNITLPDYLLTVLENSYLLRSEFFPDRSQVNSSELWFFPGRNFMNAPTYFLAPGQDTLFSSSQVSGQRIKLKAEQNFFLGLGGTKATRIYKQYRDGSKLQLRFEFPQRRRLRSNGPQDSSQELFISSSTIEILQNDYDAGYHFPFFERDGHFLHFNGLSKYYLGDARDSMAFSILDQFKSTIEPSIKIYKAGEIIRLSATNYRQIEYVNSLGQKASAIDVKDSLGFKIMRTPMGVQETISRKELSTTDSTSARIYLKKHHWLFSFHDLSETNPLKVSYIYGLILLCTLLSFIVLFTKQLEDISKTEVIIYALLVGFLTLRMVLLWRTATFVPIEDIDSKVFHKLRSPDYFQHTFQIVCCFYACIVGAYLLFHKWGTNPLASRLRVVQLIHEKEDFQTGSPFVHWMETYGRWIVAFLLSWGLIFVSMYFLGDLAERFVNIAFPIMGFFLLALPLFIAWSSRDSDQDLSPFEDSLIWLFVLNWASCWVWLVVRDAGFSIVFLLFSLFSLAFYLGIRAARDEDNSATLRLLAIGIFSGVALGIFFSTHLLEHAIEYAPEAFYLLSGGSLVGLGFLGRQMLRYREKYPLSVKLFGGLTLALSLCLAVFVVGVALEKFENPGIGVKQNYTYLQYRAGIHNKSLEKISKEIDFESRKSIKLLEASQNQWFIDQMLQRDSDKYFSLRRHFNKGASFISQTTDLVVLRYIIAEHSQEVVLGLVLLFGVLFTCTVFETKLFEHANMGLAGVALLLTIQGFFIWMTVTNRFAFFGQDFPLLSMQSRMTLFFTFGLFLLIILFIREKPAQPSASSGESRAAIVSKNQVLTFLFLSLIPVFFKGGKRSGGESNRFSRFTLGKTLESTQAKFNQLNAEFRTFQRTTKERDPKALVLAFDKWANGKGFNSYKAITDSLGEDQFTSSVWKHFLRQTSAKKLNDPNQILHLKRPESQYYEFAVNNNYYLLKTPEEVENQWMGSLLGAKTRSYYKFVYRNQTDRPTVKIYPDKIISNIFQKAGLEEKDSDLTYLKEDINNITISSLPKDWTLNGDPLVLISIESGDENSNRGNFSIVNDRLRISSKNNPARAFAYRLEPRDYINLLDHQDEAIQLKMISTEKQYLAKNLWLNGKQELFYPLGRKSIWSYNYANLLKQTMVKAESLEDKDVNVSIDYSLSESLYDQVESHMRKYASSDADFSMVAMDHKGRIRTLVDYKKPPASQFDPNNTKEYSELFQKFYLTSDRSSERKIFGNRCLQRLDNGPGSSIKPIMYTIVTAGSGLNWRSLEYLGPDKEELDANLTWNGNGYLVDRYAGNKMQGSWNIRNNDIQSYNNLTYLSRSSNIYHSLIMFLGSYEKEQLIGLGKSGGGKEAILIPVSGKDDRDFPKLKFNGRYYILNSDTHYWPGTRSAGLFNNLNSVLSNGLAENFKLEVQKPVDPNRLKNPRFSPDILPRDLLLSSRSSYFIWAYPEMSHFYQIDRSGSNYEITGIRQSTVGGFPIEVTPLKMTEMGLKMATLNKELYATLDTSGINTFSPFFYDESPSKWKSLKDFYRFHAQNTMQGMEDVLYTSSGTGFELVGKKQTERYHLYAKTGTIKGEKSSFNDRHLLFILSKRPLTDPENFGDSEVDNPMFVLYISYFNSRSKNEKLTRKLIEIVKKSDVFRFTMGDGN